MTMCTKQMKPYFGRIDQETSILNELGQAAFQYWSEIPHHHHHTTIDEFIVMPNHIHGIIIIVEVLDTEVSHVGTLASEGSHVETLHATSLPSPARPSISPQKGSLCVILRSFKTALTCCARMNGYPNFAWQPRFHDHIIRNENALYLNHKKSAPGRAFSCTYSLSKISSGKNSLQTLQNFLGYIFGRPS